jgi:hypothetical protein
MTIFRNEAARAAGAVPDFDVGTATVLGPAALAAVSSEAGFAVGALALGALVLDAVALGALALGGLALSTLFLGAAPAVPMALMMAALLSPLWSIAVPAAPSPALSADLFALTGPDFLLIGTKVSVFWNSSSLPESVYAPGPA